MTLSIYLSRLYKLNNYNGNVIEYGMRYHYLQHNNFRFDRNNLKTNTDTKKQFNIHCIESNSNSENQNRNRKDREIDIFDKNIIISNHHISFNNDEKYSVKLRVYNIDRWGLAPLGAKVLKQEVDGIYHVAVVVHNKEYWFDHRVTELKLEDVAFVRGFSPAFIYDMGYTHMNENDVNEFAFGSMKQKYNINTYDVFFHNCHHFAYDVVMKLTGKAIPQWLVDHGEKALDNIDKENAKIVRSVSNKIAKIMMVSWGRYEKMRFIEKNKAEKDSDDGINPLPIVKSEITHFNVQPKGVSNQGLRSFLPEYLLDLKEK